MNIVGIDPAVRALNLFFSGGVVLHTQRIFSKKEAKNRGEEIASIRNDLNYWLTELSKDFGQLTVFIEEPVLAGVRNIRTTIQIAETVGAVLSVRFPTYLVPVPSWKKDTIGKGNASKDQIRDWLTAEHPRYAALCGGSQDLVDAACICLYGQSVVGSLGSY